MLFSNDILGYSSAIGTHENLKFLDFHFVLIYIKKEAVGCCNSDICSHLNKVYQRNKGNQHRKNKKNWTNLSERF